MTTGIAAHTDVDSDWKAVRASICSSTESTKGSLSPKRES